MLPGSQSVKHMDQRLHTLRLGLCNSLRPGTYTSSVTFSSDTGKQEVPVKFIMSQPTEAVLSVELAGINLLPVWLVSRIQ